jgi:hypothetical protein
VKEWLAIVVKHQPFQRSIQLGQDAPIQLERHLPLGSLELARASRAKWAAQVALIGRLDHQDTRQAKYMQQSQSVRKL